MSKQYFFIWESSPDGLYHWINGPDKQVAAIYKSKTITKKQKNKKTGKMETTSIPSSWVVQHRLEACYDVGGYYTLDQAKQDAETRLSYILDCMAEFVDLFRGIAK